MKCPICDYLGFETGDRCKNCGYDFSLMTTPDAAAAPASAPASSGSFAPAAAPAAPAAMEPEFDLPLRESPLTMTPEPVAEHVASVRPRVVEPPLPLFNPEAIDDDTPLIKLPSTPRPPLAVRRTPETPRLRAVPKPQRRTPEPAARVEEPELAFGEEAEDARAAVPAASAQTSGPARRLLAAVVDHAILLGIDGVVVYFTLRLAELGMTDWHVLPLAPMLLFLGLLKGAYFCVFTLVGGQTIGKMAAQIRVVSDDDAPLNPSRAIRRTLTGALSVATLGLAFLPALFASDRRAFHDRVAGTRVIAI